jgi:DNA modification methylase
MKTVIDQTNGTDWSLYHGDCVALATQVPDNSVDISVYSPPFSSLYIYSESEADMGNTDGDEGFLAQYRFLVREKFRATRPGRLSVVHIKDQVYYQGSSEDGASGVRPLSDRITDVHLAEGWNLQCRITIWRDPVLERSKTNAHGLLYKTFRSDASFCRVGMPEYLLVFRKWPKNEAEIAMQKPVVHERSSVPLPIWQELASPVWPAIASVWNYAGQSLPMDRTGANVRALSAPGISGGGDMDLKATETLNVQQARDPNAEKHLCPMPLNLTSRALLLWSNERDSVWSPFAGIGSEGVAALRMNRRFFGTELNPSYYRAAAGHLESASKEGRQMDLFEALIAA